MSEKLKDKTQNSLNTSMTASERSLRSAEQKHLVGLMFEQNDILRQQLEMGNKHQKHLTDCINKMRRQMATERYQLISTMRRTAHQKQQRIVSELTAVLRIRLQMRDNDTRRRTASTTAPEPRTIPSAAPESKSKETDAKSVSKQESKSPEAPKPPVEEPKSPAAKPNDKPKPSKSEISTQTIAVAPPVVPPTPPKPQVSLAATQTVEIKRETEVTSTAVGTETDEEPDDFVSIEPLPDIVEIKTEEIETKVEDTTDSQTDFSDICKPEPISWQCSSCIRENSEQYAKCPNCGTGKDASPEIVAELKDAMQPSEENRAGKVEKEVQKPIPRKTYVNVIKVTNFYPPF